MIYFYLESRDGFQLSVTARFFKRSQVVSDRGAAPGAHRQRDKELLELHDQEKAEELDVAGAANQGSRRRSRVGE